MADQEKKSVPMREGMPVSTMDRYSDWMYRRSEAFVTASARYYKRQAAQAKKS